MWNSSEDEETCIHMPCNQYILFVRRLFLAVTFETGLDRHSHVNKEGNMFGNRTRTADGKCELM